MSTRRSTSRNATNTTTAGRKTDGARAAGARAAGAKAQQRRERAAEAARQAARVRQRRRLLILAGAGAAVLVVAGVVLVAVLGSGSGATQHPQAQSTATAGRVQGPAQAATPAVGVPSWPAPAAGEVAAAVRAAGLPLLTMEGTDQHFHAHLDVLVNGQAVAVPAGIGIEGTTGVSSMHTTTRAG